MKTARYLTTVATMLVVSSLMVTAAPVFAVPRGPAKPQDLLDSERFFPKMDPQKYKNAAFAVASFVNLTVTTA